MLHPYSFTKFDAMSCCLIRDHIPLCAGALRPTVKDPKASPTSSCLFGIGRAPAGTKIAPAVAALEELKSIKNVWQYRLTCVKCLVSPSIYGL
jgi:hypothetical protein